MQHELWPGKFARQVSFDLWGGARGALVRRTHPSRGLPCEWWRVPGDHRRVELRDLHEVREGALAAA